MAWVSRFGKPFHKLLAYGQVESRRRIQYYEVYIHFSGVFTVRNLITVEKVTIIVIRTVGVMRMLKRMLKIIIIMRPEG